jgi:hypothetical protein
MKCRIISGASGVTTLSPRRRLDKRRNWYRGEWLVAVDKGQDGHQPDYFGRWIECKSFGRTFAGLTTVALAIPEIWIEHIITCRFLGFEVVDDDCKSSSGGCFLKSLSQ